MLRTERREAVSGATRVNNFPLVLARPAQCKVIYQISATATSSSSSTHYTALHCTLVNIGGVRRSKVHLRGKLNFFDFFLPKPIYFRYGTFLVNFFFSLCWLDEQTTTLPFLSNQNYFRLRNSKNISAM